MNTAPDDTKRADSGIDCRFMDGPFTKNCIYSALGSVIGENGVFKYDYVMGLDIGGGGNTAHIMKSHINFTEDGRKQMVYSMRTAVLDKDADGRELTAIPSMIAFTQKGMPVIGFRARERKIFNSCFKTPPSMWNAEDERKRNTFTSKELTKAFILQLFKQILEFNSLPEKNFDVKKAYEDKKLLICVGCPASPDWMQQQYRDEYRRVISDACDIDIESVYVLPESTAAVMSVVGESSGATEKRIDITQGICIFDLGAVSADITHIVPGKRITTYSFLLGGQDIDKQMLEKLLCDSGVKKTAIPPEQIPFILSVLKEQKESFYENGTVSRGLIKLWEKAEDGSFIDSDTALTYTVDEAFMNDVLDRPIPSRGMSLAEAFENELKTKVLMPLRNGSYDCSKLIVSGGTGKVTRFRDIIKDFFGENITDIDMDPEKRVSRGLCDMKRFEISGADAIKAYREAERLAAERAFPVFTDKFCAWVTSIVTKHVSDSVSQYVKKDVDRVEISELCSDIIDRCRKDDNLAGAGMHSQIASIIGQCAVPFIKTMTAEADKLSQRIYKSSIITVQASNITKQLSDSSVITEKIQPAVSALWDKSLSNGIILIIAFIALMVLGVINPLLPIVAVGLLMADTVISQHRGKRSIIEYLNDREIYIPKKALKLYNPEKMQDGKIYRKIEKHLKKELSEQSQLKELLNEILTTQSEIILGKLLLQVFDE